VHKLGVSSTDEAGTRPDTFFNRYRVTLGDSSKTGYCPQEATAQRHGIVGSKSMPA